MATEAQINANRANARCSTGPRTDTGKARSSKNAVKHGFNCSGFIVTDEQRPEFDEFRNSLEHQIEPVSAAERETFRQLLVSAWNLRRVRRLEEGLFDGQTDPLGIPEFDREMDRYARYEARFERSYYRALNQLRQMKTDNAMRAYLPASDNLQIGDLVEVGKIVRAKRTQNRVAKDPLKDFLAMEMSLGEGPIPPLPPQFDPKGGKSPAGFPESFGSFGSFGKK